MKINIILSIVYSMPHIIKHWLQQLHVLKADPHDAMKECICDWLDRVSFEEMMPSDIKALNIGLYQVDNGYCIYLVGSKSYDADDDDWACCKDFEAGEVVKITSDTIGDMNWETFQQHVVRIITDYISTHRNGPIGRKIVTVGFDDGNLVRCLPYVI